VFHIKEAEALGCSFAKLLARDAAVQIGVGRGDRFGNCEQAEPASAGFIVASEASAEVTASRASSVMPSAAATSSTMITTLAVAATPNVLALRCFCRGKHRASPNLRRDNLLIVSDLIRIDFAIMIRIKQVEEALRIGGHFVESDRTVMVPVGLFEPNGQAVLSLGPSEKWLSHRTHESKSCSERVFGFTGGWRGDSRCTLHPLGCGNRRD